MSEQQGQQLSPQDMKSSPSENEKKCGYFAGGICPNCEKGVLDYNGMLNLECPECGIETGYGFT